MTANGMTPARPDDFDLLMADWLDRDARVRAPEGLVDVALARTARTRPLPGWRLPERWLPLTAIALRRPMLPRAVYLIAAVAVLLVALAVALMLSAGQPKLPPPLGPAANGHIAYVSNGQVTIANPDGSGAHAITSGPLWKGAPTFSRDGTKLAYRVQSASSPVSDPGKFNDLVVTDADGSNARVLLAGVEALSNPHWSPDGSAIAITTGEGLTDHAYLIDVVTGSRTDLGDFGGGAWTPTWSPDGTRLAIAAGDGLWVVDRTGRNARKVTTTNFVEVGEQGQSADWSPAGTELLFTGRLPANGGGLYVVNLAGTTAERLIAGGGNGGVWSPDGRRMAYFLDGDAGTSLVMADAAGTTIRTFPGLFGWYMPEWSPDGTKLLMRDDRPGADEAGGVLPPVTVIFDVAGGGPPLTIAGTGAPDTDANRNDYSASWQRVAVP